MNEINTCPRCGGLFSVGGVMFGGKPCSCQPRTEMKCRVCGCFSSAVVCWDCTKSNLACHSGDCTIYSSMMNGRPVDGICTCGYGWHIMRAEQSWREMYSIERRSNKPGVDL